jgi:F-type H+-transporting ATPase subunit b
MDPTWYPNQLLWLAVSFFALYAIVARFIAPSIKTVLDTRANAIDEAIAEAERAKRAADATRGDSESAGSDARNRAADILAKTQSEINRDAADATAKLNREIERRAEHAAAVLEDAVAKASAGVDAAAQSLAETMAQKLLGSAAGKASTEPHLKLAVKR